ncbi:MAG TPA: hypothetical protein VIR77_05185 [Pontiella sp.]
MKRTYRRRSKPGGKKLGQIAFTLFIVYIAYRILTPSSNEVTRISPDGSKTAKLRTFYYYENQPSYKIYYRESDKHVWLNLLYLPAYTNIPSESATASIQWSPDSDQLHLLINETSIWHHVFRD